MGKKKSAKSSTVVLKAVKPRKSTAKKKEIPVDIERVRERMKTNKPPQSWYDEENEAPATVVKKAKPKKASPKVKPHEGLTNAELRELAKTNKPPQSWYDEDHTGLY